MRRWLAVLLLPLALGACVQSVNPLYTGASLVSEPALVGTWIGESGDLLVVTARDGSTYGLAAVNQDGDVSQWVGRVTTLGGRRWLDVEPAALPPQWSAEYRDAFLPTHTFFALQRVDSVLVVATLAVDSLSALIDRDPSVVAVARGPGFGEQGNLLFTAETAALRAFVAAFAERPGALEVGEPMRRVSRPR
jgi:hypothetical protein